MLKLEHIDRSDNLRIIPHNNRPQAEAFMQLIQGIENGTAVVRVDRAPDTSDDTVVGKSIDPKAGDLAAYKSRSGDVYNAVVVGVRAPGVVDVDVVIPGVSQPLRLTRVKYLTRQE